MEMELMVTKKYMVDCNGCVFYSKGYTPTDRGDIEDCVCEIDDLNKCPQIQDYLEDGDTVDSY